MASNLEGIASTNLFQFLGVHGPVYVVPVCILFPSRLEMAMPAALLVASGAMLLFCAPLSEATLRALKIEVFRKAKRHGGGNHCYQVAGLTGLEVIRGLRFDPLFQHVPTINSPWLRFDVCFLRSLYRSRPLFREAYLEDVAAALMPEAQPFKGGMAGRNLAGDVFTQKACAYNGTVFILSHLFNHVQSDDVQHLRPSCDLGLNVSDLERTFQT